MDGVLWHAYQPLVDVKFLFKRIHEMGLTAFCVTNNSTRSVSSHLKGLAGLGIELDAYQIITSAEATAAFLEGKYPQKGNLFVIGERGLREALEDKGFGIQANHTGEEVLAVIVGLDQQLVYQDLRQAVDHLQRGADFVGTNPDLTIPTSAGPAPGAGTIIRGIEVSSGVTPQIIGKPHQALFQLALTRAKCEPGEALMVGDRLETDIRGAQAMGIHTALVLSGISSREQAENWEPKPDIIADDVLQVLELIGEGHAKSV